MNESIPDLPMSDDLHRAAEELIDAALVRDADPHRHRVAVKWMEAEEKVDRLARALASVKPSKERLDLETTQVICHACGEITKIATRKVGWGYGIPGHWIGHAPDCVYIEAVEHVAALEHQ